MEEKHSDIEDNAAKDYFESYDDYEVIESHITRMKNTISKVEVDPF